MAGGTGKPEGLETGYYVRPTVFANVDNNMTIAREEIFGPVVSILGYTDEENAVQIANDTNYGLAGYICSNDMDLPSADALGRSISTIRAAIPTCPLAAISNRATVAKKAYGV